MSGALLVLEPGLFTTVQDLGRRGAQRLGIPVSGALDPVALRLANLVVGNPQTAAGLEIALAGPLLEVAAESARVAVAGGSTRLSVERAGGGAPLRVSSCESVTLGRGDRVRVGTVEGSAVAVLAVAGGFALAPVMGSLATYVRGGFGGLDGRPLRKGDRLPLGLAEAPAGADRSSRSLPLVPPDVVRVVLGPQDDYFTAEALAAFIGTPWRVSREADRMGLRLDGPRLAHAKGADIVSDGIAPGTIQVPGSGQPIVLLADRQTTGGYPKIATVVSADLPALGRVSPGAVLRFAAVTVAEAEAARRDLEARIRAFAAQLAPVPGQGGADPEQLLAANLISGVIDARALDAEAAWIDGGPMT